MASYALLRTMCVNNQPQRARKRPYYGWTIVGVMMIGKFTHSAETFPILGVFLKPITEEFGWTRSQFTWAMTIGTIAGSIVAVGAGRLLDRYGGRWLMASGFVVLSASFLLMARMTTIWEFYTLQIFSRLFHMGVLSTGMMVIVPQWFIAKRGRAVALGNMGSRAGGAAWPLFIQWVLSISSWRLASAVVGGSALLLGALPAAIFLRRRPEDIGLLPDGITPEEAAKADADGGRGATGRRDVSLTPRQVIKMRSFYFLTISFSLLFFAASATNLHLIPYLTDQGISNYVAVWVVTIWAIGAFTGSFTAGVLSDRLGARWLGVGQALVLAVGYAGLMLIPSGPVALAWGLAYGFFHGWSGPLQQVMLADYFGRHSLGAIRGMTWPFPALANAIGPIVASLVFDNQGSYLLVFGAFVAMSTLGSLLLLLAPPPKEQLAAGQPAGA